MDPRRRAWLLLAMVAAISVGAVGVTVLIRSRPLSLAEQVKRLPERDGVIVFIDFSALRKSGLLSLLDASKAVEDPDYQRFAKKINLNWRDDLDAALLSVTPHGKYMLVTGRFDWRRLRSYALESGGECNGIGCRMIGSAPDRHISFRAMRGGLMGLAVSPTDDWAVEAFDRPATAQESALPDAPVWVRLPGATLRSPGELPSGTRMFAHSIEQADSVTLMLSGRNGGFEGRLNVDCRNEHDAAEMAGELTHATVLLREMIEREHQTPNPADFSGVLTSGSFYSQGRQVLGTWPIDPSFLRNLLN